MSPWPTAVLILLALLYRPTPQLLAQETPIAFVGARILPVAGAPIESGVVVVQHGRIIAVGDRSTPIPNGASVRDVAHRTLIPGLVDTHSHIGAVALAERSNPIQPELRVLDSFDVRDASLQKAQAGGITTINAMPGSGMLCSGQTLYLKLREARTIDGLLITNAQSQPAGGLKMANGTNPHRDPPFPGTRAKSAALVRQKWVEAQDYRNKITRAAGDPDKLPARNLSLEPLVEALEGRRVVHHHTHRADDILTVLRLRQEFGFRVVLQHVTDGWQVAEEIARADVPCSIIVIDSPGGKIETRDLDWRTGSVLEKAGVLVGFHTDDNVTDSRLFLRSGALAVRAGMSATGALAGLTVAGARMLDLDDRIGTLEPGKDADLVVLSGDPFSVRTQVLETWVEGQKVFDRTDPKDLLWATGGPGAGNPKSAHLCCFETTGGAE